MPAFELVRLEGFVLRRFALVALVVVVVVVVAVVVRTATLARNCSA